MSRNKTDVVESSEECKRNPDAYPRVLIIVKNRINDIDGNGASIRNWFLEWPKDRLAQIYSGGTEDGESFCGSEFRIKARDRRFGALFRLLKVSTLGEAAQIASGSTGPWGGNTAFKRVIYRLGKWLLNTGIWELVFRIDCTRKMLRWVESFKPEVIYAQGNDIAFMRLPVLLRERYGLPICLQISDDWPEHLYSATVLKHFMRPIVEKSFSRLINETDVLLGTSDIMAREYACRYAKKMHPLMICDDSSRFSPHRKEAFGGEGSVSVVYSGSMYLNRWECFIDLARAAESLKSGGAGVQIIVYTNSLPAEAVEPFSRHACIRVMPALRDNEVPRVLCGAGILFLPESFSGEYREYIKFSISTKAHLYMMSERPILVYGPSGVGVVEYARDEGWGLVVSARDIDQLSGALTKLIKDSVYISEQLDAQRRSVQAHHEGRVIRESLRNMLISSTRQVGQPYNNAHLQRNV